MQKLKKTRRKHKKNRKKQKQKHKNSKEHINKNRKKQKSPSQTFRDIYFSRRFVGWKSCISVVFCFRLIFLSFCLNTTQYTTLNTNKLEMGLFITCVKCSKQCFNSYQITLLSLQISKSFVLYTNKLEKVHLA